MDVKIQRQSGLGNLSFSVVSVVGVLAVIMAGATVWLLLTDPVTPLVRSLAGSLYEALVRLLRFL